MLVACKDDRPIKMNLMEELKLIYIMHRSLIYPVVCVPDMIVNIKKVCVCFRLISPYKYRWRLPKSVQ